MLSLIELANRPQYHAPHDPILAAGRLLQAALPNFANCLNKVFLFELSPSPMPMHIVFSSVGGFRLFTNIDDIAILL